jgi:hypothetical protein
MSAQIGIFQNLPREMIEVIFFHTPVQTLFLFSLTCKTFRKMVGEYFRLKSQMIADIKLLIEKKYPGDTQDNHNRYRPIYSLSSYMYLLSYNVIGNYEDKIRYTKNGIFWGCIYNSISKQLCEKIFEPHVSGYHQGYNEYKPSLVRKELSRVVEIAVVYFGPDFLAIKYIMEQLFMNPSMLPRYTYALIPFFYNYLSYEYYSTKTLTSLIIHIYDPITVQMILVKCNRKINLDVVYMMHRNKTSIKREVYQVLIDHYRDQIQRLMVFPTKNQLLSYLTGDDVEIFNVLKKRHQLNLESLFQYDNKTAQKSTSQQQDPHTNQLNPSPKRTRHQ